MKVVAQRFAQYVNPVLKSLKELGGSARPQEVYHFVADTLQIPESVRDELHKSGVRRFENDIAWARSYLVKTGYIDKSRRGVWALTEKGRKCGALSDDEIREVIETVQRENRAADAATQTEDDAQSAIDDEVSATLNEDGTYRDLLLDLLRSLSPSGFERLCQRLLRESGFEEVTVTGRSGDGGIDGIGVLRINPFVTLKVLFQCKRWQGTVGPAQVRDFRGAMMGRADKGIVLTTGAFSSEAHREAVRDGVPPIELIGADELMDLFEQLELGLTPRTTFDIDVEFFKEFQD